MRRWGQIAEPKSDEWFFETAQSVYQPDIYLKAARLLVDDGMAEEADFPWDSDGFKAPTPADHVIDAEERALLAQLKEMISDKTVIRVP